jgi:hypothetical protein
MGHALRELHEDLANGYTAHYISRDALLSKYASQASNAIALCIF